MSRVTPPVNKLIRSLSSTAQAASPSSLINSSARSAQYAPLRLADLKEECGRRKLNPQGNHSELVERLSAHDNTRAYSTHTSFRPIVPKTRTRPLMQGFHTSPPVQTAHDTSTIDFVFLPEVPAPPPSNPFSKLRVPLLPDNYNPDRSMGSPHAPEVADGAVAGPEILIVASHPENVIAAALTEVVGNDGQEAEIGELTKAFSETEETVSKPGIFQRVWGELMDDIKEPGVKHA